MGSQVRKIVGGTGITVTNGTYLTSGDITIAASTSGSVQTINAQTGTTYTIAAGDLGQLVTINNAGAVTVTVPSALSGSFVDILILSTGTVAFVGGSGVSLTGKGTLTASGQYTRVKVQWRTSTNAWITGQGATIT